MADVSSQVVNLVLFLLVMVTIQPRLKQKRLFLIMSNVTNLLLNERTTYNCWNVSSAVDVLPLGRIVTACLVKRGEGRKKRSIHTSLALSQSGTLYRQIKKNNNNNLIVSNVLFLNLTKNGAERVLTLAPSMCFTTLILFMRFLFNHISPLWGMQPPICIILYSMVLRSTQSFESY